MNLIFLHVAQLISRIFTYFFFSNYGKDILFLNMLNLIWSVEIILWALYGVLTPILGISRLNDRWIDWNRNRNRIIEKLTKPILVVSHWEKIKKKSCISHMQNPIPGSGDHFKLSKLKLAQLLPPILKRYCFWCLALRNFNIICAKSFFFQSA